MHFNKNKFCILSNGVEVNNLKCLDQNNLSKYIWKGSHLNTFTRAVRLPPPPLPQIIIIVIIIIKNLKNIYIYIKFLQ